MIHAPLNIQFSSPTENSYFFSIFKNWSIDDTQHYIGLKNYFNKESFFLMKQIYVLVKKIIQRCLHFLKTQNNMHNIW